MPSDLSDQTQLSNRQRARFAGALRADYRRYLSSHRTVAGPFRARLAAALEFGFIAICVYRYGRWTRRIRPRILAWPFAFVYHLAHFATKVLFGIDLSTDSRIGPGFYIGHFGGIIIYGNLGAGCSVGQGVTIGSRGAGRSDGYPDIGDRVFLGAGSMVIGSVRVGSDVIVGANTVVVEDVPAEARVVSARARILPPRKREAPMRRAAG
jgi:serine O-acetyltransferase